MKKDAKHLETGKQGELEAAQFLVSKGYEIIAKNYRQSHAEIDLIVKKGIFLVFVEVKTRTNLQYGMPEQAVSSHKVNLITRAANHYIFDTDWQGQIRFDIVSVIFGKNGTEIAHFEDAFY